MMSLALLMTFSTCDPFNKAVHIKLGVSFILIWETDRQSGHVMPISVCVRVCILGNVISLELNVKNLTLAQIFLTKHEIFMSNSLFTLYFISATRQVHVSNWKPEDVQTNFLLSFCNETENLLASDLCLHLPLQTNPPFSESWELVGVEGRVVCDAGHGSQRTHHISSSHMTGDE